MSRIRLRAVTIRYRLFRNNRGAAQTPTGSWVRYGLANDTKALGDALKSGDLIGWRPVVITADMVGSVIAQFTSVEVKSADWKPTASDHEEAQRRWRDLVNRDGGYAVIINDPAHL